MTIIVSAPEPRYQRRKKAAKAAQIIAPIVLPATKPSKRVWPSDDVDQEVPDSIKAFVKRMMQPP